MKPEPTTDDPIELAAAEWLVRQDRGLTPAEQAEFEAWRRADARHAALYQALAGSWDVMSDARHAPSLLAGQAEREAARAADAAAPRRRRTWRVGIGLAAAAALVFSSVVGYREYRARPFAGTLATQVGGVERLTLPDGSTITLNTDSAVAVQVDRATRRVALQRGEAHFTVAKDRSRPFIVSANGVDVRAVGTAFSVRLRAEVVDVLVTEGKVSVAPPEAAGGAAGAVAATAGGASVGSVGARAAMPADAAALGVPGAYLVTAGHRTSVPIRAAAVPAPVIEVPAATVRQALAWQERRLDFEDASLGDIVAEMNRYSARHVLIEDPELAAKRFGGSFPAGDVDTLVRQLQRNFRVTVEQREEGLVLHAPE